MPKNTPLPEWERVLSAAAHLQELLPEAVLVGGTAAAIHARHRFSRDADHVLTDLRERFDKILAQLESVAGWKTARVQRPVQILGSLDGIETGIRQLIREAPLETTAIKRGGQAIRVPTKAEILRIKSALILRRNATRDYLDFVALADQLGDEQTTKALRDFDRLYPQPNNASALQQLQIQLANPLPYDLEATRLAEYKNLAPRWQDWQTVAKACARCAIAIFEGASARGQRRQKKKRSK
ncbi:MAG TPA: nucleotidyl transferase AbiEii/AbiGii toxin family protein [Dongiaceae bacterium]|nr:nucleotidyl transferase AbiEii/AbiGii toxin family protein [Dongiaceae bacterium]